MLIQYIVRCLFFGWLCLESVFITFFTIYGIYFDGNFEGSFIALNEAEWHSINRE